MIRHAFTRIFLATSIAACVIATPAAATLAAKDRKTVDSISRHFSGVPSMMGEFIQFGPNGEQTGGKFYIQRPGKLRLDYTKPSPILVKADGKTIGIHNRKLKTWDFAPLSQTPFRLLLSDRIDAGDKAIKSVSRENDMTTVVLRDSSRFGSAKITMMFDPKTFELRQWTVQDDQGKETSVMIFNVKENVRLSKKLFRLDQASANRRNVTK